MSKLNELVAKEYVELEREVQLKTRGSKTFEEAASRFTGLFYDKFKDSLVLTRLFVTVPFAELPATNRGFVTQLAQGAKVADKVNDQTLILSLAGTRGVEPDWNDRRASKGHVGIPLASSSFIEAVPMMARLLKELGLGLDWIDSGDTSIVGRVLGSTSGVFYVSDAAAEVDNKGRKVIAGQEFVNKYGVKTVFGLGGAFMGTSAFVVLIAFCREHAEKAKVEAFMPLINRLKVSTLDLVKSKQIFGA